MMKLENTSGATIQGSADTSGAAPCDPVLRSTVPTLSGPANDFAFASVNASLVYPVPHPSAAALATSRI